AHLRSARQPHPRQVGQQLRHTAEGHLLRPQTQAVLRPARCLGRESADTHRLAAMRAHVQCPMVSDLPPHWRPVPCALAVRVGRRPMLDNSLGVATSQRVSPRCPSFLPGFFPPYCRGLLGLRLSRSLEGGLELVWRSLASRASRSYTRAASAFTCSRRAACSASHWAWRSSSLTPPCPACSARLADLLPTQVRL